MYILQIGMWWEEKNQIHILLVHTLDSGNKDRDTLINFWTFFQGPAGATFLIREGNAFRIYF